MGKIVFWHFWSVHARREQPGTDQNAEFAIHNKTCSKLLRNISQPLLSNSQVAAGVPDPPPCTCSGVSDPHAALGLLKEAGNRWKT